MSPPWRHCCPTSTAASLHHNSTRKQYQCHTHTHACTDPETFACTDRSRHPHTCIIIPSIQKVLDMKNSSIPNVLEGRRTAATGLPEVVAPLSHTVGLIHTHQGQGHEGGESLQQHCAVQPLWGHIQYPQPTCLHRQHMLCCAWCMAVVMWNGDTIT